MNHSPFQDWIFDDPEQLTQAQSAELHRHVLECADCRTLSQALTGMERSMRRQPVLAPEQGFASRWQSRLQADRALRHRRQTRLAFGISLACLVTLFGGLMLYLWPWLNSFEALVWAILYQFYWVYQVLAAVGEFATRLLVAVSLVIPPALLILAVGMAFELGVLWIVSFRLLTNPRRIEVS